MTSGSSFVCPRLEHCAADRPIAPPIPDAECRVELRALVEAGMDVGAHTLTHPVLSQLSAEEAWCEISESRSKLEEAIGRPVWALAYPFGDAASVTEREREMAERAGFTCAFVNSGGGFGAPMPRFALPRVHVTGDDESGRV